MIATSSPQRQSGVALAWLRLALQGVPEGAVVSYGELARRAGLPGRARQVARLLAQGAMNDLPWWRVLRSDGHIAMPPTSPLAEEQRRRLLAEGWQEPRRRWR